MNRVTAGSRLREEWLVLLVDKIVIAFLVGAFALYIKDDVVGRWHHIASLRDSLERRLSDVRDRTRDEMPGFIFGVDKSISRNDAASLPLMKLALFKVRSTIDMRLSCQGSMAGRLDAEQQACHEISELLTLCDTAVARLTCAEPTGNCRGHSTEPITTRDLLQSLRDDIAHSYITTVSLLTQKISEAAKSGL
jgi:hypothetical protein